MACSSPRASSLAWRIAARESAALSGRRCSRWAATPAWTLITPMVWETTSCSSLAIRIRSSSTRRRASSSRVRSARSARSRSSATYARRARTASPHHMAANTVTAAYSGSPSNMVSP